MMQHRARPASLGAQEGIERPWWQFWRRQMGPQDPKDVTRNRIGRDPSLGAFIHPPSGKGYSLKVEGCHLERIRHRTIPTISSTAHRRALHAGGDTRSRWLRGRVARLSPRG